ncbi:hypothetical protein [Dietzia alimentaria]|uniref:hypothetical protein n=1 Tax=Dietzia alimentaria TaxID=665550 RepID=UPI00029A18A5|nr:hypothetical protein [Dietzia alimentaria]
MKIAKGMLAGIASAGLFANIIAGPAAADEPLPGTLPPDHPCNVNYFQPGKGGPMWEITWGRQYDDTSGTAIFKASSYGGVTQYNGGPVPAYMDPVDHPNWQNWYVTPRSIENNATVRLDFADGTVWHYRVSADANGCPAVEWRSPTGFPEPEPEPEPPSTGSTGSLLGGSLPDGIFGS